jgi:hypothetical protein
MSFFRSVEMILFGTVPSIKEMCEECQTNKQTFYTGIIHQNKY